MWKQGKEKVLCLPWDNVLLTYAYEHKSKPRQQKLFARHIHT